MGSGTTRRTRLTDEASVAETPRGVLTITKFKMYELSINTNASEALIIAVAVSFAVVIVSALLSNLQFNQNV